MVVHPSSDTKSVFIREAACDVKSVRESVPRSLWETYSAFANTNGGTIVLGVVEDDEKGMVIEGVPDVQGTLNGLWNGLNNTEKVSANLLTDSDVVVTDVDGKELIVIRVPRANRKDRPLFINGNTRNSFRRNGEGDYRCTPDEINSMITDSMSGPTDRVPVNTSGISDFDPGTVSAFRNSMRTLKGEHPWNNLDDGEFLRVVGAAVDSEGTLVPTLAGLLMFGRSYCIMSESYNYHLDYREYVSDDEWSLRITSGDGEWSGNVYDFYIRVMNSLKTVTGRRMAIDDDMRRVEDTQLDKCMREMLVNALVNADYRGRAHTSGDGDGRRGQRSEEPDDGDHVLPHRCCGTCRERHPSHTVLLQEPGAAQSSVHRGDGTGQGHRPPVARAVRHGQGHPGWTGRLPAFRGRDALHIGHSRTVERTPVPCGHGG